MAVVYLLVLLVGFELLYKGSDVFVDGSIALAERFGIPDFAIGLTIVAMGTSLPETAVSVIAAIEGNAAICIGNVVGSDILNILLILGLSAFITPLAVSRKALNLGIPFMAFCAYLMYLVGKDGVVTIKEGCFLLFVFFIYLIVLLGLSWKDKCIAEKKNLITLRRTILFIVIGLITIIIGSKATVYSATEIAKMLKISDRIVALTIVALGTSLPELFTSVNAARKGNANIAVGNIVGSNIYNILFIIGVSSFISSIEYEKRFLFDSWINVGASALLFVVCFAKNRISRLSGVILLIGYGVYFAYTIIM